MRWPAILTSLAVLAACQTTPEPCTPEWVEWKSDRILTRFAMDNRSEVRRLRDFSQTLQQGDISPMTALQVPGMIEDFKILAADFDRSVLPKLNSALAQCNSVQELAPAFVSFLRKEGVSEDVLEWVEFLSAFVVDA